MLQESASGVQSTNESSAPFGCRWGVSCSSGASSTRTQRQSVSASLSTLSSARESTSTSAVTAVISLFPAADVDLEADPWSCARTSCSIPSGASRSSLTAASPATFELCSAILSMSAETLWGRESPSLSSATAWSPISFSRRASLASRPSESDGANVSACGFIEVGYETESVCLVGASTRSNWADTDRREAAQMASPTGPVHATKRAVLEERGTIQGA